jgi:hypothetical protein
MFIFKTFKSLFKNQDAPNALEQLGILQIQRPMSIDFDKIINEFVSNGIGGRQ